MSVPASPNPTPDGAPERPRWRVRLLRARPADARRRRHVYAGSLVFHALVLSSLAFVPVTRALIGKAGRETRIQVAWDEPQELFEREQEPERPLEPEESTESPELVEQELPPEPLETPPEEPPLPPLDDRAQLDDPLRDVASLRFAPRPPEARPSEPPAPEPAAVAAPPPQPAARPPAEPAVLEDPEPSYPRAAVRMGHEGSVTLRALVARDGSVIEVLVLSSSGYSRLDESARAAFLEWRFRAWQAGEPEPRTFRKTFTFKLP